MNAACGQVSRPRAARRDHHVLQEHAEVEPAALAHDPVDREHEADRRAEELVVAPVLRVHPLLVGLGDAEQAVEIPADLAAPVDEGRPPLGRVVRVLLAVAGALDRVVVGGDELRRQRLQRLAGEDVDVPRLRVRPRRRARRDGEDRLDRRARHRRRQEGADRVARGDRGLGRAAAHRSRSHGRAVCDRGEGHGARIVGGKRRAARTRRGAAPRPQRSRHARQASIAASIVAAWIATVTSRSWP